ncbi:MAG: AAA family ATPase, partial [Lachnospiraceae bacterium]|nr:AAA family ATPase [Lachnospiraceae bacterium]
MKTISILNLKGGVAKTFTAANMAYELYRRGYKVLLLDNDKQGNLSKAYGRYDAESVAPITKLLSGEWLNPEEIIQHTDYEGIDIITANMSLFGATWNLT